jgi:hypothetical protein
MRLGHESCVHIMFQRCLPHRALEQEDLICKLKWIAMVEVDFKLRWAAFMTQRINIKLLCLAEIIDVFNDRVKIIGRIYAVSLTTRLFAA